MMSVRYYFKTRTGAFKAWNFLGIVLFTLLITHLIAMAAQSPCPITKSSPRKTELGVCA